MKNLNKNDIEFLIDCLKSGKEIPEAFRYDLFPTTQKEYELVYAGKARKEDVLADKEEAKPVPLQIEKVFNGTNYPLFQKDWHNLLVFGDNLQILKTFYENKDAVVKDKIKGKVKLIYIDPPFATKDEFQNKEGAKAYNDKKKGAEFIEFLRRRLIVAKELLDSDGYICCHVDQKMNHYVKIVMDEVFGKNHFANEIVWRYFMGGKSKNFFSKKHDTIYIYTQSDKAEMKIPNRERVLAYKPNLIDENSTIKKFEGICKDTGEKRDFYTSVVREDDVWEISGVFNMGTEYQNYPTQKPEDLLQKLILATTNKGDLVFDFFCGSGTTLAVAEKLGRRWIGCDIGKLAIYATQKRLLQIGEGRDLESPKKKYGKPAKSFAVVASGLYDLGKIFTLEKEKYIRFVKDLFEIEEAKRDKIGGVEIDGMKRGFPAKIFPYWEMKRTSVDEKYLDALHKNLGRKVGERFYIIAPANNVDFISDYHEIDDTKYYFLKVPYQIIKELHKVPFKKLHQPQSKSQINDLEEAKGFHFIRPPEVEAKIKIGKDKIALIVKKFETAYTQDETGEKLKNFESLAMLLVDLNYDGEKFMMTHYFFAEDLLNHVKKDEDEESAEKIKKELKQKKEIMRDFPKKECGKQIMAIYVDIYGNEFREVFNLK
ncbi:MAG: site-specific DNA-methyltransferase [Patescibacteria group bacterium]